MASRLGRRQSLAKAAPGKERPERPQLLPLGPQNEEQNAKLPLKRRRESFGDQDYVPPDIKKPWWMGTQETETGDQRSPHNTRSAKLKQIRRRAHDAQGSDAAQNPTRDSARTRAKRLEQNWGTLGKLPVEIIEPIIQYVVCNRENRIELLFRDPGPENHASRLALWEYSGTENRNPFRNAVSFLCVNKAFYNIAAPVWYGQVLCLPCSQAIKKLSDSLRPQTFRMIRHVELNGLTLSFTKPGALRPLYNANLEHINIRNLRFIFDKPLRVTGWLKEHKSRMGRFQQYGLKEDLTLPARLPEDGRIRVDPLWVLLYMAVEGARQAYESPELCGLLMHFWRTNTRLRDLDGPSFVKTFLNVYEDAVTQLDRIMGHDSVYCFFYDHPPRKPLERRRAQVMLTIFCERLGQLLSHRKEWEEDHRKLPKTGRISSSKHWEVAAGPLLRWLGLCGPELRGRDALETKSPRMWSDHFRDQLRAVARLHVKDSYYSIVREPIVTCL